jgi:DNA-binding MarR family transcriptional regulator
MDTIGLIRDPQARQGIAEALELGAALLARHLARGTNLTSRVLLATLEADGPVRLTALAAATGVSQPSMTQLVARLEREGLANRLVDPEDARATLVAISEAGRALRAELLQAEHERLGQLLDTLSRHDEATLSLAMYVASPLIRELSRHAAKNPQSRRHPGLTV